MKDNVTTFAAIKTFYDSGCDLIDVFSNLVILTIPQDKSTSLKKISAELVTKIDYKIPTDVLRTLLKRLRKTNLVTYEALKEDIDSVRLTDTGKDSSAKIRQNYDESRREKNALVSSLKRFFFTKGKDYSDEKLIKYLDNFLDNHCADIIYNLSQKKQVICDKQFNEANKIIANFLSETEKSSPENFQRLKSIIYGKILAEAFLSRGVENAKIKNLVIYLDTNIVFSLMGFHEEYYNDSVKEVVNLIKNAGCSLKIFSFTKDEINNKLRGYLRQYCSYSTEIPVNSIYYFLKNKGYSKIDVLSLIDDMESRLKELGIEIDYSFDLNRLLENHSKDQADLETYKKQETATSSIRHDLAAILAIKSIRKGNRFHFWEKSCSIFLSADSQLTLYDYKELGHEEYSSFPEVILKNEMVKLLWLKGESGSDNVFVHNFLASYKREDMISTDLWNKFLEEVRKKKESGNISESSIEEVISYSETERILKEKGEKGISEILDDYRIRQKKLESSKKDEDLQEIKKELIQKDEELKSTTELVDSQIDQVEKITSAVVSQCTKSVNYKINIGIWISTLVILLLTLFLLIELGLSNIIIVISLLPLIVLVTIPISMTIKKEFSFFSFFVNFRVSLENRLTTQCVINTKKRYQIYGKNKDEK